MGYQRKSDTRRTFFRTALGCFWVAVNMMVIVSGDPCGSTARQTRGEITSPNYPGRFPTHNVCLWRIIRPVDGPMTIKFPEFNMEGPHFGSTCDVGFLKVYDGDSTDDEVIAYYCGTTAPTVHTTSNNAIVVLYAYEWKPGYGFRLTYGDSETCESKGGACRHGVPCLHPSDAYCKNDATCCMREASCGGVYSDPDGLVKSPNFPGNYDVDLDCVYTITIRNRHQVALKFKEFDLEGGVGCPDDYLVVYDGPDVNSPIIGSRLCGSNSRNILTTSNSLTLLFHSNRRVTDTGFQALWIGTENPSAGCYFWENECRVGDCDSLSNTMCPDRMRCCQAACDLTVRKICPDGTCISNNVSCPNVPPLPDGGVHCVSHATHCPDGSCIFGEYDCGCTLHQPHRCDEGQRCYSESEKCDTHTDCLDGSDEEGCADPAMTGLIWGLIAGAVVLICGCCCYCCCCRKKKKKDSPTTVPAAGHEPGNTTENTALTAPEPQPQPQPQPYPTEKPPPQPYGPDQPQPYAPGHPQPYAAGQPQPYAPGQPQPYAPGYPQPYPPGQPQAYPPPHPMGPPMGAMPNYGSYPPMAAPSAPPPPMQPYPEPPPPYEAASWSNQPQEQPVEILKPPLEENC